ncbi:MAG: hypothetical protein WDZ30_01290 [Cellvibrionaceae bacterium]
MINKHLNLGVRASLIAAPLLASALCLPALGHAQTIEVPVGQQAQQKRNIERPTPGMKQSQVENLFGRPIDWQDAVGDPPISSWIYPDFIVYFEYDDVLHTVLRGTAQPLASTENSDE